MPDIPDMLADMFSERVGSQGSGRLCGGQFPGGSRTHGEGEAKDFYKWSVKIFNRSCLRTSFA